MIDSDPDISAKGARAPWQASFLLHKMSLDVIGIFCQLTGPFLLSLSLSLSPRSLDSNMNLKTLHGGHPSRSRCCPAILELAT